MYVYMVKSLEDAVENYVASVPMAMWKYKKYLMREKNFEHKYAVEKSIDYGEKMLGAGLGATVPPELAIALFKEFAIINTALADRLEREMKERLWTEQNVSWIRLVFLFLFRSLAWLSKIEY